MSYLTNQPSRPNYFVDAWISCDYEKCDEVCMTDNPADRYPLKDTAGRTITSSQYWLELGVEQLDPWITKYLHFCCNGHLRYKVSNLRAINMAEAIPVTNWESELGLNYGNLPRGIEDYTDKYHPHFRKAG